MFRIEQIVSASHLLRNFAEICSYVEKEPQALLVTRKSGNHMVLVNAEVFQDLLDYRMGRDDLGSLTKISSETG